MSRTRARAAIATATVLVVSALGGTAGAATDSHAGVAFAETWVTVPNVIGESQSDATGQLTLLGFHIHSTVEYTEAVCTSPVPPPEVAEQSPEAGSLVLRGANISLGITTYKWVSSEC